MNKLMMRLTIGSEAIFFICLIVTYLFFWRAGSFQHEAAAHLHLKTTGLFTVLLLASSFTYWRAEKNHQRRNDRGVKGWLLATLVLGSIFLAGQVHEYYKLLGENVWISESAFGSSFYTLTGFHGLHVLIGLIVLVIVLLLVWNGHLQDKRSAIISTVGIYWHFVDVVWVFVFTTVYLLPHLI